MTNVRALRAEFRVHALENKIKSLVSQLHHQAPQNGQQAHIKLSSEFKPAAEYDGVMGSLMLEHFVAGILVDAESANDNAVLTTINQIDKDWLETGSEYLKERSDHKDDTTHNNFGRGRGSIALYERPPLKNKFNSPAHFTAPPAQPASGHSLEKYIAELIRERDVMQKQYEGLKFA